MDILFVAHTSSMFIKVFEEWKTKKSCPTRPPHALRTKKLFRSRVEQKEIFFAHKCKKARTREGRKKSHKYFGSVTYVKFYTSLIVYKILESYLAQCEHAQVFVLLFPFSLATLHPSLSNSFSIFTTKWLAMSINHVASREEKSLGHFNVQ